MILTLRGDHFFLTITLAISILINKNSNTLAKQLVTAHQLVSKIQNNKILALASKEFGMTR
jgi:hypothetical protein